MDESVVLNQKQKRIAKRCTQSVVVYLHLNLPLAPFRVAPEMFGPDERAVVLRFF